MTKYAHVIFYYNKENKMFLNSISATYNPLAHMVQDNVQIILTDEKRIMEITLKNATIPTLTINANYPNVYN